MENKHKILNYLKGIEKEKSNIWNFGNKILYDMCSENPLHIDEGVVTGKVWLIGRSYAAALERTKIEKNSEQIYSDFAREIIENSHIIDKKIKFLDELKLYELSENLQTVFELHSLITSIMKNVSGLDKRSLASKYLHFHCPHAFFIYDSRARKAINALVGRQNIFDYKGDSEYIEFYLRALKLKEHIKNETGFVLYPRDIDDLLLYSGVL